MRSCYFGLHEQEVISRLPAIGTGGLTGATRLSSFLKAFSFEESSIEVVPWGVSFPDSFFLLSRRVIL